MKAVLIIIGIGLCLMIFIVPIFYLILRFFSSRNQSKAE